MSEKIKALKGPIFIFGASGFIGINLFKRISCERNDCYAITHDYMNAWRLRQNDVAESKILFCDITFSKSLTELFSQLKPNTVFNLSAYGAYSKQNDASLIYDTNFTGCFNLVDICKNSAVAAFVQAGSSSEYGYNCNNPNEEASKKPNSHYAVSKISAGYLLNFYASQFQFPSVNLRLYSIYGPWEEPDRLMPRLIEGALMGTLPALVSPDVSRDFVYVADCVDAFIHAAYYMNPLLYGKSINIGTGIKTRLDELVNFLQTDFNITAQPQWNSMESRQWDTQEWVGNYALAAELIHWKPSTELRQGIELTAKWQKDCNYSSNIVTTFNNPSKLAKISCVIACYKDAEAIPVMYERLLKVFNSLKLRYEIIFVNDASPDNAEQVLESICNSDKNVVCINHSRNFGSQAAFISGMEIARGDAVVLMDGDLQDPPELIADFVEKWQQGFDVVYGTRVKRDTSFFMNFFYKVFYRSWSNISYIKIPLDAGDFSLIDRKVVEELIALPEKEQFLRGLRAWVGFKQTGVDYQRPERMFGKSTNNWRKNIWWAKKAMFSFSFAPLELMSYFGFLLTGVSFLAIIFQIISKIIFPETPHGISTIIVLVLFFGGIQLLAISILGEYIAKIFEETKGRPKFIRKSIIVKGKRISNKSEIKKVGG